MSYLSIKGGVRPEGEILLQGSKNATLPILAASVLCRGKVVLENCPDISDVRELLHALRFAGVKSRLHDRVLEIDASDAFPCFFGADYAEKNQRRSAVVRCVSRTFLRGRNGISGGMRHRSTSH